MNIPKYVLIMAAGALPAAAQLDRIPPPTTASPLARNAADVEAGQRQFRQLCTGCHGRDGEGGQGEGRGPNLMNSWEVRRAKDAQLFESIKNGIKGTAMPPFPLPDAAVWRLVAFVRSLNAPAATVPAAGDPAAGERLFFGRGGCAECHRMGGRGGYLGPDLSDIANTRRVSEIRTALLNPKPVDGDGYQPLLLTDPDGRKLRAVARHISDWSIQALDEKGVLHLLHGAEMRRAQVQTKSWMPADLGQRLSPAEIDSLVAFLSRPAVGSSVVSPAANGVTSQDLLHGPKENWLTYIGDYFAQRHSPLAEINTGTVSRLAPKWVRHIDTTNDLETVPLVLDGVMYATGSNEIFALDAATGREIWRYRAPTAQRRGVNRGAGILGDRVFFMTGDCHLLALGRSNGAVIWDREYASSHEGFSCSGAPLVVKDKVIVGVASSGRTCFIAALSAITGEEVWRVSAVPKKGEPGSDTWGNFPLDQGGGPTWTPGSYDPALNLLYWPTGNPWPDFYGGGRPGDNLYTDCILALDADSGKMKWYFQFVPHDTHDWDANETPVLLDADYEGKPRKLLLQANRNGFYYILDRTNGRFLRAVPFVKDLNWAKGVDAGGRPMVLPNTDPSPGGVRVCPSVHGATNWWSPSLDPGLGLFYVVALEQCETYYSSAQQPVPSSGFRGTGHTLISGEPGKFYLRALDAKTGELRWEYPMPGPTTMWAGTVSTAGGLVFSADDDGDLVAVDAKSGKALWHFYTGATMHASPMAFSAGGKEYVTIAAGTNLFTFGLM